MADRPILFSAPMVRALLDGRKTQTRRILKPQPFYNGFHFDGQDFLCHDDYLPPSALMRTLGKGRNTYTGSILEDGAEGLAGYFVGDRLWVRESWRTLHKWDCLAPRNLADDLSKVTFEADPENRNKLWAFGKLRPGIFMPRWASRLTLTVTDVRVERLNDISEADARAEGCSSFGPLPGAPHDDVPIGGAVEAYEHLWDEINGAGAWATNPWVVAVTFDVHRANIDSLAEAA